MFYAVREALAIVEEEGLENRFARHRRNHLAFVAGCEAMGLTMHAAPDKRLCALNTVRVPQGIEDLKVRKRLMDGDGIEILGGFGPLAGQIFRVGLMGAGSRRENVLLLLDRFQKALVAEGFSPSGDAVSAAEKAYS
jgi:alanine-glyoxylate transaminase/serine-glyoxylate transaminase/serine-pyruvate transaminase